MRIKNNYILTSKNLGYHPIREDDFDNYLMLDTNPKVRQFLSNGKTLNVHEIKAKIKKQVEFFQKNNFGVFTAIELDTGKFVGRCGFIGEYAPGEIEVGYVFLPEFWGKGLATECLVALLNWAKKNIISADSVIALTPITHLASQKVMEKAGMEYYKHVLHDQEECILYKIKNSI